MVGKHTVYFHQVKEMNNIKGKIWKKTVVNMKVFKNRNNINYHSSGSFIRKTLILELEAISAKKM